MSRRSLGGINEDEVVLDMNIIIIIIIIAVAWTDGTTTGV
jgi:hypothetical protein